MDELGSLIEEQTQNSRPKSGVKRKSYPAPVLSTIKRGRGRPPKQPIDSSDEGIGLSLDPLNDSIAQSVKRRKRSNTKQFDSNYFLDSVVKQIETKYKNKGKDDAIIDLQNLEIIDKKGFVEQRVRTEFGFFAENTLEDLRQNSFRNKELISCPLIASTPSRRQTKIEEKPVNNKLKTSNNQRVSQTSTSRAIQLRDATQLSVKPIKKSLTDIIIASDDDSDEDMVIDNNFEDSDEESIVSNQSEELDENHPLMIYENQNLWTDKDYQILCFKKTIELIKNDRSGRFIEALKLRAKDTINLPALPTGPNVFAIIRFNSRGEPNFEFRFLAKGSPFEARDELNVDPQIISLSKTIYDCLNYSSKKSNQKRLTQNRRQLEFN